MSKFLFFLFLTFSYNTTGIIDLWHVTKAPEEFSLSTEDNTTNTAEETEDRRRMIGLFEEDASSKKKQLSDLIKHLQSICSEKGGTEFDEFLKKQLLIFQRILLALRHEQERQKVTSNITLISLDP